MIKRLLGYKWYIIAIVVLIIIEPTITSWLIFWVQNIYNTVSIGTPRIVILRLILIGVLVWLGKRLLLFAISVVKSRFICNIKQDLKHDIFSNVFNLSTANITQIASSGEYISAFTNDITIIEQKFFSNIISVVTQIFSIIILGASFVKMNYKLAIIMLVFGIFIMFVPSFFAKKLNETSLAYSKSLSNLTQVMKEYLQAYSTIKNYSIEKIIIRKFNIINSNVEDSKFKYDCSLSLADSIGSLLTWFTSILIIGVGLIMVSSGEILIGTVIATRALAEELSPHLQGIVENVNSIKSVKSIINRMNDLSRDDIPTREVGLNEDLISESSPLNIEFRNLTLAYNNKKIVDDFSFTFKQGGKYLVIGKNGSGKSSIFKAMKKRFKNMEGDILINNIKLNDISNSKLSQLVSYLNENVSIFSGSIEDNIRLWRGFSNEKYTGAMQMAHVNLDSKRNVGEEGFDISSGEQRRIEIARTLISPTRFLIFDEVVSTLDIETAYDIEKMALDYDEKTVVFISHNFSGKLIKEYDEILVMKDGCLVAHGPYDELISSNDYFRKICEIKFGDS